MELTVDWGEWALDVVFVALGCGIGWGISKGVIWAWEWLETEAHYGGWWRIIRFAIGVVSFVLAVGLIFGAVKVWL